jgi:hypothetical protein
MTIISAGLCLSLSGSLSVMKQARIQIWRRGCRQAFSLARITSACPMDTMRSSLSLVVLPVSYRSFHLPHQVSTHSSQGIVARIKLAPQQEMPRLTVRTFVGSALISPALRPLPHHRLPLPRWHPYRHLPRPFPELFQPHPVDVVPADIIV